MNNYFESLESRRMLSASTLASESHATLNEAAISMTQQVNKTPMKAEELDNEAPPET